jgi:hypothetical protein
MTMQNIAQEAGSEERHWRKPDILRLLGIWLGWNRVPRKRPGPMHQVRRSILIKLQARVDQQQCLST